MGIRGGLIQGLGGLGGDREGSPGASQGLGFWGELTCHRGNVSPQGERGLGWRGPRSSQARKTRRHRHSDANCKFGHPQPPSGWRILWRGLAELTEHTGKGCMGEWGLGRCPAAQSAETPELASCHVRPTHVADLHLRPADSVTRGPTLHHGLVSLASSV